VSVPKLIGNFLTTIPGGFKIQSSPTSAGFFALYLKPTSNVTDTSRYDCPKDGGQIQIIGNWNRYGGLGGHAKYE